MVVVKTEVEVYTKRDVEEVEASKEGDSVVRRQASIRKPLPVSNDLTMAPEVDLVTLENGLGVVVKIVKGFSICQGL